MAESNLLKRFLDAGVAFTELTQARAEAIIKDLVAAGEVQTNQAQAAVTDLIERSRENTERLLDQLRSDIRSQVDGMGLATKVDISRLESLISTLGGRRRPATKAVTTNAATTTKSTPAKKATAKTATAKKTPAKRAPAKKAAKRPAAKKTPTRTPAKTAAKRPPAQKATKRSPAKAAAKKR